MKILMANTYHHLRGGDSRCALGLTALLEDAGHDVVPFAMQHASNLPSEYERHFAEELDFPGLMRRGGLSAAWTVARRSIHNGQAREALRGLLGEVQPDVAHLHSVMHHLTAAVPLELRRRSIPTVWTLHDLKSVCPTTLFLREGRVCEACKRGRFYNALRYRCKRGSLGASAIVTAELYLHRLWKVYERANLLITPSRFLKDKVLEAGLRPRRIEVVPNFVVPADRLAEPANGEYVLFVGRLEAIKGVEVLLEASARAGGVPLRIVGTGELEAELRRRVEAEDWSHVRFEGHRQGAELDALYRGARAVAVPSTCQENSPMVVLEAFAHGLGVLGTTLGGVPELVAPERTGLLAAAGDIEAWSGALRRVMRDGEACRAWGEEGLRRARRDHSPEGHRDRIVDLYRETIAAAKGGGPCV